MAPEGFTWGNDGRLYVGSGRTDEVLRYDGTTGAFMDVFVAAGSGGLDGPVAVDFGPDGHLYVSSEKTDEVLRYDGATGVPHRRLRRGSGGRSPRPVLHELRSGSSGHRHHHRSGPHDVVGLEPELRS